MSPILEAIDLAKHYGAVHAVNGVSFQIKAGSCFGLLGPNGAGKTTTVEMIEGITPPTAGAIRYRGEPIGIRFKREAGIQFQSTALQDFLTVREHIELFQSFYPRSMPLDELTELCALDTFLDRDARKLSGGQRQRMLLAIALANDPDILFLDEPTTGLDPQARRNFWELVRSIKRRGKTILLTTHYMEEAYVLCDRVAIMDHGKIITEGPPGTLLREHFHDVILELPREDFELSPDDLPFQVLQNEQNIEISTSDVNGVMQFLLENGVPLQRLQVRPRTLEDLFLELTGKELRA